MLKIEIVDAVDFVDVVDVGNFVIAVVDDVNVFVDKSNDGWEI